MFAILLIDAQGREIGRAHGARAWDTPATAGEIAGRLGLRLADPGPGALAAAGLGRSVVAHPTCAAVDQKSWISNYSYKK